SEVITEPFYSNKKLIMTGAFIMVITQIVMVAIMTMTPVHMGDHGHTLRAIGFVIGLHIAAMYLPSPLTGILVVRLVLRAMALSGGMILLASGLVAATEPGDAFLMVNVALLLLGVGWNFGLIGGTALIVGAYDPSARANPQGSVVVFIALV